MKTTYTENEWINELDKESVATLGRDLTVQEKYLSRKSWQESFANHICNSQTVITIKESEWKSFSKYGPPKEAGTYVIAGYNGIIICNHKGIGLFHQGTSIHWLKLPSVPIEDEFEKWWQDVPNGVTDIKNVARHAWVAAKAKP